jgi:hypothetical protein
MGAAIESAVAKCFTSSNLSANDKPAVANRYSGQDSDDT